MTIGFMASCATEIETIHIHVNVKILAGRFKRAVQVPVLHTITAAAVEVAGATGGAFGGANFLGYLRQVDAPDDLSGARRKLGVLVTGKPAKPLGFLYLPVAS